MNGSDGVMVQRETPKVEATVLRVQPKALQKHALPPDAIPDNGKSREKKDHPLVMDLRRLADDLKNIRLNRAPGIQRVMQIETKIGGLCDQIASLGQDGNAKEKAHDIHLTARDIFCEIEGIAQFEEMPRYGAQAVSSLKTIARITSNGSFDRL